MSEQYPGFFDAYTPREPGDTIWDVVVIGAGAGGGTAGYELARLGCSVLFLEYGAPPDVRMDSQMTGRHWNTSSGIVRSDYPPYAAEGRRPMPAQLCIGCGIGGSTRFFNMVMDRFRPIDFQPRDFSRTSSSTSLPGEWPICYQELEPYYREAEAMFRIRGTQDPLGSNDDPLLEPAAPSSEEAAVHDALRRCGLSPYRIHYARDYVPGCDGCPSRPCPRECRNDVGRICVLPALQHHRAQILFNCRVVKLGVTGQRVDHAACVWNGRLTSIRGRVFVLALNALLTPGLLLNSVNESFPNGLGNQSGMVGRNLMLHVSDFLFVRFEGQRGLLNERFRHGISLNDFYVLDGTKLGNIHAHSMDSASFLNNDTIIDDSEGVAVFSTILEDFPYVENRVLLDPQSNSGVSWNYTYPGELHSRRNTLISAFSRSLDTRCTISIKSPGGSLNPAHMCGTCRFGSDPRISVLDPNCRVHELDNTYVLDASFFPSSSGINPSLTIVANSLRVSRAIASQFSSP